MSFDHPTAASRNTERLALGELLYPDPEPTESAEQLLKFLHDDLAGLTLDQIDDQRLLTRMRRALSRRPSGWLLERIARLDAAAARLRPAPAGRTPR